MLERLARTTVTIALSVAGCASPAVDRGPSLPAAPRVDARACGPEIANLDAIASAPLVLLGEMHGITAAPAFAVDLACRLAVRGKPVLLALEIPRQEQPRVDAYLASRGEASDRDALLAGAFWRRDFQDGRSSEARVQMLDTARRLRARGVTMRVECIDDATTPGKERDRAMADALLAARRPGETAVLLVGNLHARTKPGAPWDPKMVWSGVYLRAKVPDLLALDNRYAAGDAWVCFGEHASDCGAKPIEGRGARGGFGVERFATVDENGLDGVFDLGAAAASRPAIEGAGPAAPANRPW